MFSHKTYLKLDDFSGTDYLSPVESGYELSEFELVFTQGTDDLGKATTEVRGGDMRIIIPALPSNEIIGWMLDSRKYKKGVIVIVDADESSINKIYFENTACVDMDISYKDQGKAYIRTILQLRAERLMFNDGMDFDNFWTK
jgi:hypothetical protein